MPGIDPPPYSTQGLARCPATGTPEREPGSVRRTSHIDMVRLGATSFEGLSLAGAARDVRTAADGRAQVTASASVRAELGEARVLRRLETQPTAVPTTQLVGRTVGSGFRAAVDGALPEERDGQTPLYQLLDELPVAALISGYGDLYLRAPIGLEPSAPHARAAVKADLCAGWAREGTMLRAIDRHGRIPIPVGPPAPVLEPSGDPLAWHEIPPLAPGAMRRGRRIDVAAGNPLRVDAMFRDTHVGPDGGETVLHEWSVEARVEPASLVILECTARAHVLPWVECPSAVASASRLEGRSVRELRRFVRGALAGTSTCTHLNDLLRSLADIAPLARSLAERSS